MILKGLESSTKILQKTGEGESAAVKAGEDQGMDKPFRCRNGKNEEDVTV